VALQNEFFCYYLLVADGEVLQVTREERLKQLKTLIEESTEPLSGEYLSNIFNVSRQAIVQDIAILRNRGFQVVSTPQGYFLPKDSKVYRRIIAVKHSPEDITTELMTIISLGGKVIDVIVEHPIYGEIRGNINVATRDDVVKFVTLMQSTGQNPLLSLSQGFHLHTIEADSERNLDEIEKTLKNKGFLVM
jgi:hypothetical protein